MSDGAQRVGAGCANIPVFGTSCIILRYPNPKAIFGPKNVVSPYPDAMSLGLPFFPHSMITLRDDPSVEARRGRVGFVLGKGCNYFEHGGAAVVRRGSGRRA